MEATGGAPVAARYIVARSGRSLGWNWSSSLASQSGRRPPERRRTEGRARVQVGGDIQLRCQFKAAACIMGRLWRPGRPQVFGRASRRAARWALPISQSNGHRAAPNMIDPRCDLCVTTWPARGHQSRRSSVRPATEPANLHASSIIVPRPPARWRRSELRGGLRAAP